MTIDLTALTGLTCQVDGRSRLLQRLGSRADTRRHIEEEIERDVLQARNAGCTWAEIGRALGMTKRAVERRYGPYGGPRRR